MKHFKYQINGQDLLLTLDETHSTVASITFAGKEVRPTADDMPRYAAVIALALLQYDAEVVHDEEEDILTISSENHHWGMPGSDWAISRGVQAASPMNYPIAEEVKS